MFRRCQVTAGSLPVRPWLDSAAWLTRCGVGDGLPLVGRLVDAVPGLGYLQRAVGGGTTLGPGQSGVWRPGPAHIPPESDRGRLSGGRSAGVQPPPPLSMGGSVPDAGRQVCRGLQPAGPEEEEARGPGLHRPHTAGPASADSPRPANRGSPRRDGVLSVRPGRLARLIRFLCWNGGSSGCTGGRKKPRCCRGRV